MATQEKEPSFEEAFRQLEETVQALSEGGRTLDESIVLFERGMRLAKLCQQRLEAAELRIRQLQIEDETPPETLGGEDGLFDTEG